MFLKPYLLKNGRIVLWTAMKTQTFDVLNSTGTLCCNKSMIDVDDIPAYDWMVDQMTKRIGPSDGGEYPMWAWAKYARNKHRPDLRKPGYFPRGTKSVLIEYTMPIDQVLLTDFGNWHCVLNDAPSSANTPSTWVDDDIFQLGQSIQATMWKIDLVDVTDVTFFTAK